MDKTTQSRLGMDLSRVVEAPPETVEDYWRYAAEVAKPLGTEVINLEKDKLEEYVDWVEHVEDSHGATLYLDKELTWVKQQLRTRPERYTTPIPLIDYNTVALHLAGEKSLENMGKGERRASASRAYSKLGAINHAEDLGLYLAPLVPAVIMKPQTPRERAEYDSLEEWSIDSILRARDEFIYDLPLGRTRLLDSYTKLALEPHHQPGRLNFSTSMLMEMGTYFIDLADKESSRASERISMYDLDELAEASLFVAKEILEEAELEFSPGNFNHIVEDELIRRQQDLEFIDIHRKAKFAEISYNQAEAEFINQQLNYINEFKKWAHKHPHEQGIAFEWLTPLVLRHYILKSGQIDNAYTHYATPRADYPEDGLRGNASSRKQSYDVFLSVDGQKYFYQCKLKNKNNSYADPPIYILKARAAIDQPKTKSLMPAFLEVAKELEQIYTSKKATESDFYQSAESSILEALQAA